MLLLLGAVAIAALLLLLLLLLLQFSAGDIACYPGDDDDAGDFDDRGY